MTNGSKIPPPRWELLFITLVAIAAILAPIAYYLKMLPWKP